MSYSIKAVKTFRGREGIGVDATVYWNTTKVAEILDDGWGGGIHMTWLHKTHALKDFEQWATTQGGDEVFKGTVIKYDWESWLNEQINHVLSVREAKKLLRRPVMLNKHNQLETWPKFRSWAKASMALRTALRDHCVKAGGILLNTLAQDEAVKLLLGANDE